MASNGIMPYEQWRVEAEDALQSARKADLLPLTGKGQNKHPISTSEAWLRMERGRELGLKPLEALHGLYVVDNRVALEGAVMLSIVQRSGLGHLELEFGETEARAKVYLWAVSKERPVGEVVFTEDDARRAGLLAKDAWRKYKKDLLGWRAVARACRFYFPALFGGPIYTPDELEEVSSAESGEGPLVHWQREEATKLMKEAGLTTEDLQHWCEEHGIAKPRDIPRRLWEELLDWIASHKAAEHEGPKRFVPKTDEVQPSLEEVSVSDVELDEG